MRHIKDNRFRHIDDEFTEESVNKPKRQIFCPACKKAKLLFPTEKKAIAYMEYNASAIKSVSGYCPIRAYYCTTCGGWHVTSHEASWERSIVKKILGNYKPTAEFLKKIGGSFDKYFENFLMTA